MKTELENYIIKTNEIHWVPLNEPGVDTKGISFKVLKYDEQVKRATCIMLKFDAGASYPYHNHPGGEEAFVLEGEAFFNTTKLSKGDYLHTPPDCKHSVKSENGCTIFFIVPEEVEIL